MGVVFMDGFTHYATADTTYKWDTVYLTTISNATPRRSGTQYASFSSTGYLIKNFASQATIYCGFAFKVVSPGAAQIVTLNLSGSEQCNLYLNADNSISVRRSSTVLGTSAAGIILNYVWQYLEFEILVDNSGTFDVYLNGVNILTGSGDTQNQASAEATSMKIGVLGNLYITDLYIADDSLKGDCRIDTLMPDGAGNYTDFTPSAGANYECVDDANAIDEDSTYVSSSTVTDQDVYDMDDLSTLAGSTIYAVALNNCCRKDDAGTRKFKPLAYVNSSDYYGDEETLNDSYHVHQYIWDDNPDDASAWEEADIDGSDFGLELTA